jgi:hypothetical protein
MHGFHCEESDKEFSNNESIPQELHRPIVQSNFITHKINIINIYY